MKRRLIGKIAGYITYLVTTINKTYGDSKFTNPVSIVGDGVITYSSNNTTVATVNLNTGEVTIVKPGIVTITASVSDSTYYSYETKNITYILNIAKAQGNVSQPPVSATIPYTGSVQNLVTAGSGTGTMYYKLNNGGWSTNIPTAINHDTYTVYYKAGENDYYTESSVGSLQVTIPQNTPDYVAPTAKTLVYNSEDLELLTAGSTSDGTIYYSIDNSTWSETIPTGKNAGTYTVYWKLDADNNHTNVPSTSIEVTIDKAVNPLTATKHADWIYDGESYALVSNVSGQGTITYSLNSETYTQTIPEAINVGTYTVKVNASGNSNYYSKEISFTILVSKVTPTVTAPTAKSLTYTGSNLALVNAGSTNFGTLKYSLDNSTYSTTIPVGKNAGIYTVYYRVDGDSNINDVSAKSIEVTIAKANPSYTAPTANNRTYDTTSKALLNAGSTSDGTILYSSDNTTWSTTIPSLTNAGTYTTYWRIVGDNNHNDKASTSISTTISPKTVSSPTITLSQDNYIYSNTAYEPIPTVKDETTTISSNEYTVSYTNNINAGTATCVITDKTGGNYTISGSKTFTISKVTPTVTAPTANDLTYTGDNQALVTAGSTNWGTMQYSTTQTGTYSTTIPTGKDAGNYEVWYKVVGDSNINDVAAVKVTITIKKADPIYTAPTAKTGLVYNTSAQALLNGGSASGGTLLYSSNNSTWSTTIPTGTNASTYTSYWRIVGDSNHNDKASASINTTISPKTVNSPTITLSPSSYTYNGNQCKPTPTVKDETVTISSEEYTVSYSNNTNVGTATCTITDKTNGNYTVSGSKTFTISKVTPTVTAPTAKVLTYNGSELILANAGSTNFGTLKYSLDNSTWSTSVPTATNGGSYTLYYKVDGDSNINSVSASSINCSINEKEVTATVTLSSTSYTYDGNAKTPTVTVKDGSTVIPSSEYTVTYSNNINAGTATVTITDKTGGNYNVIGSATFTINKAAGSVTTKPTAKSLTYNGDAQTLVNAGSGTGTMYYSLNSSSGFSTSIPTGTAAGTYTVYFYAAESSNYSLSTPTESVSVTIGGKSISIPTPTGYSAQYNGSAHTATFGSCTGASITKYRYSTDNSSWTESTTNPSLTNVGTLYTQAYYTAEANYTGSGWSSSATISISRNTSATASAITGLVYNGTTESNGSGQTGVSGSQVNWSGTTSATNAGSYTAYATPTSNYAWSDGTYAQKTISWSIARRGQTAPVLNGASAVFHNTATATVKTAGTVSGSTATAPGTLIWSNQSRTAAGSQTATAYYEATATNFSASPVSNGVTVQITQASDASVSVTLESELTYSRGAQTLATATSHGCTYYLIVHNSSSSAPSESASGWTNGSVSATNAGTYYIWYRGTKDSNHSNDVSITYKGSVTINKATPVIATNPSNTSPTYNGSALNLLSGGSYKHSSTDTTAVAGTFTYLQGTNAGDYANPTWTFTPTDTANYNSTSGTRSGTVTTIAKASLSNVTITFNTSSFNYNGNVQKPSTITVKSGSTILTSGTHYTLSYSNSNSTNAGTYSITANATGNYSFTAVSANYTINKINPTITAPTAKANLVYSGSALTLYNAGTNTTAGSFAYTDGSRTAAGSQTVSWSFTPTDTTNYNSKSGSFTGTIDKAPQSAPTAAGDTTTYNTTATATASGGGGLGSIEWFNGNTLTSVGSKKTKARWSGNSNYYASDWSNEVTITMNKANPTITATPTDRNSNYTGSELYLLLGGTANIAGSFSYSTGINAGTYTATWTFTPTDTTNYNTISGTVTAHIKKIDPTITAPTVKSNLVYSGASLTLYNGGSNTTAGSFSYTNGTRTNAGNLTVTWTFTPTDTTNYNTKTGTLTGVIAVRPIKVTAGSNSKTYDKSALTYNSATAEATGTNRGLVSGHSMTSCTVTGSITNVGTVNNVPSDAIIKSGSTDVTSNYSITYVNGILTITTRTVTLTWGTVTWTYDKSAHSTTCTAGNLCSGDTCTVTLTGNSITNKGTTTVTASSLSNSNYALPSSKTNTLTVNARTVTLTWGTVTWTYDKKAHSTTCTAGNLCSGDSCTVTLTGNSITNKGTTTVTASSLSNSNYALPSSKTNTLTINARTVTLSWGTVTWTYDRTAHSTTCTAGNVCSGDTCTVTLTGNSITNKGTTTVTASSLSNSNYALPSSKTATLTINARTVTLSWGTVTWAYDGKAHSTTCTAGNVCSGDSCTVTLTGNSITNVGTTTVTASSLSNSNYTLPSSKTATLTINKATGSVTTAPTATNPKYTGSAVALVNGGSGTGTMYYRLGTSGSFSTTIPAATAVGSYTIYYYAAESTNYNLSGTGSVTSTISYATGVVPKDLGNLYTINMSRSGTIRIDISGVVSKKAIGYINSTSYAGSINSSLIRGGFKSGIGCTFSYSLPLLVNFNSGSLLGGSGLYMHPCLSGQGSVYIQNAQNSAGTSVVYLKIGDAAGTITINWT